MRSHLPHAPDTIVALATPPGRSALAVVRISGPATREVLQQVFRARTPRPLRPRRPRLGLFLASDGRPLDEGLLLLFAAPQSFTGEDLAECTLHGSPSLVAGFVASCRAAGARPASPGEFTLRALQAGRIDLTQAEAINDLIEAQSVEQGRIALRQWQGEVGAALAPIADQLFDLVADTEASLDFADGESDLGLAAQDALARVMTIIAQIERVRHQSQSARRLREGARCVLLGPPNAGKSSLFNALVGGARVIVSDEPGTTRDVVEETIVVDGLPIVLVDTAGVGDASGNVEAEAMRRALDAARRADLVLRVYDGSRARAKPIESAGQAIIVATHADLELAEPLLPGTFAVSSTTGQGLELLRAAIARQVGAPGRGELESVALVTERHCAGADRALGALVRARTLLENSASGEVVALELRAAVTAMHEILGVVGPEELLGRIFSRFCVGK